MGSWQPERLLYRGSWRHLSFELLAGLTHRIDKPDCQFTNAVGLAQFDGFLGDQVGADADRGGAGQNEVGDVELVDASGGVNQLNVADRSEEHTSELQSLRH